MARFIKDRVRETSTSTGTGPITLDGAPTADYLAFAAAGMAIGDTAPVLYIAQGKGEWEVVEVTRLGDGRLSRAAPTSSSNGGAAVSFTAGRKEVILAATAADLQAALTAAGVIVGFDGRVASVEGKLPQAPRRHGRSDIATNVRSGLGARQFRSLWTYLSGADAGRQDLNPSSSLISKVTSALAAATAPAVAFTGRWRQTAPRHGRRYQFALRALNSLGVPWVPFRIMPQGDAEAGLVDAFFTKATSQRLGAAAAIPTALFTAVARSPALSRFFSADEGWPQVYACRADVNTAIVAVRSTPADRWEIFTLTGQSNAVMGGNSDFAPGGQSVITTPPYSHGAVTFAGGPVFSSLSSIAASTISDAVPLAETAVGESPVTAAVRWLEARDIAGRQRPIVRLGETHGYAGQTLAQISVGTGPWTNGLMLWAKAVEFAQKYGAPGAVIYAVHLDQGEADRTGTALATYVTQGQAFQAAQEPAVRAITRQPEPVWWAMTQLAAAPAGLANAYTALAHQTLLETAPRTTIVCPGYFLKDDTSGPTGLNYGMIGVHHYGRGHDLRGEYHAKANRLIKQAIKAAIETGEDPWSLSRDDIRTCLRPDRDNVWRVGADIFIPLILPVDGSAVVLDTTTLPAATNYGFVKVAGAGGAISAVALVTDQVNAGRNFPFVIKVTVASAGGATLRHAYELDAGACAAFTASITTNVLDVTAFASGAPLAVGMGIAGGTTAVETKITALGTGTGGVGTYTVSKAQTVASGAKTSGPMDRASAWGNFRDDGAEDSIAVPGLKLRNWLITFEITVP